MRAEDVRTPDDELAKIVEERTVWMSWIQSGKACQMRTAWTWFTPEM